LIYHSACIDGATIREQDTEVGTLRDWGKGLGAFFTTASAAKSQEGTHGTQLLVALRPIRLTSREVHSCIQVVFPIFG